ncbi:hypothetical protein ASPZODRAFT_13546 [Penicilliopsis zonata CBS 506.65]|uniref:Brix domain-containing protein n=1 Tax=Penicilliopsis zonata CBS 506.65 TaxID=1073090 RepID=A0A1L9SNX5_9EURO|nr:hypothetical protein ASPZODRAFT_13546 [Penicilliopsis zonata CBS 506.65]OJJ48803.1 hypothetical protein ASPZODRAFT_13546 [Penicilliopsis zonata CBS 506.65]
MVSRKGQSSRPDTSEGFRPGNKLRRQALHVRRKKTQNEERHKERHSRRKEETRDPKLKAERLRQNIPLTLERKRQWDEVDSDTENVLGVSIDFERVKRLKDEPEQEQLGGEEEVEQDSAEDDEDEVDSMIATSDEEEDDDDEGEDDDEDNDTEKKRGRPKSSLPTATDRATSPTHSTKSTNLNLAPEALAEKFPTLFSMENPKTPKILVTTGLNGTLHDQANTLTSLFPNSVYIRRTAHRHAHKFSIREISSFAANRNFTALVVLQEDQKKPSGLTIVHLPQGPTFHFTISNWVDGKKLPGHGNPTDHWPELILNNFRTPLGLLTAHLLRTMFPPQPEFEGRNVISFSNQRDYIFVRRHRYVFREKREREKSVVGSDGQEMKGAEGIKVGLQELGPRLTLKLRRVDKGIQRASGQEWEWKGGLEKERTKFQL